MEPQVAVAIDLSVNKPFLEFAALSGKQSLHGSRIVDADFDQ